MKTFISYSSRDVETARLLAEQLRKEDFIIMRDQDFLDGGQPFNTQLEQVLRSSDVVLLLLTKFARDSRWVNEEIIFALELNKRVIPLKLEPDVTPPFGLKSVEYIDMSDRNKGISGYDRLVDLLRRLDREPEPKVFPPTPDSPINIRPGINPFIYGNRVPANLFAGRERVLRNITQRISSSDLQSISVVANRRMGKSSVLNYLQKEGSRRFPAKYEWVFVYLDMTSARARSPKNVMAAFRKTLMQQLPADRHNLLWKEDQNGEQVALEETMDELRAENIAVVLLLDEWEGVQAHIELNGMVNSLRALGNSGTIAMVTATAHELVDIYWTTVDLMRRAGRDPNDTSTFHGIFKTEYLGIMPTNEWQQLVTNGFSDTKRELRPRDLTMIGELAGGHPYLTQLAASLVWNSVDEGWTEADIRRAFKREAEPIFTDLWHKETVQHQASVLRQILGIRPAKHLTEQQVGHAVALLKDRGVLKDSGEIFAHSYADFIRSLDH